MARSGSFRNGIHFDGAAMIFYMLEYMFSIHRLGLYSKSQFRSRSTLSCLSFIKPSPVLPKARPSLLLQHLTTRV